MLSYLIFFCFCIILFTIFLVIQRLKTYKLFRKINTEVELVKIMNKLLIIENKFIRLKSENKFKNLNRLDNYLLKNSEYISKCNMFIELDKIEISTTRLISSESREYFDELTRAPKEIQNLVENYSFLLDKILRIKKPLYWHYVHFKKNIGSRILEIIGVIIIWILKLILLFSKSINSKEKVKKWGNKAQKFENSIAVTFHSIL